ncbi:hypothetical protein EGH10_16945 [Brevibacillus laterosporus]|nr:hypothetical protein DM460_06975 [Brevibacillus laterosporus]TPH08219.1 hypothetical protein EGH10_16945 [Brevibacillus laterosporus]
MVKGTLEADALVSDQLLLKKSYVILQNKSDHHFYTTDDAHPLCCENIETFYMNDGSCWIKFQER